MCMLGSSVYGIGAVLPVCPMGGWGGPPLLDYDNSSSRFVGLWSHKKKRRGKKLPLSVVSSILMLKPAFKENHH